MSKQLKATRGQTQSPASEPFLWGNEGTVCEVCNPKRLSSAPWSLHPPHPPPLKLPRWPSPCIHVPALPPGYSSLSFQLPHTTLRQEGARWVLVSVCVCEHCPCLHACLHTYLSLLCCVGRVHIFAISEKAAKGKVWKGEWKKVFAWGGEREWKCVCLFGCLCAKFRVREGGGSERPARRCRKRKKMKKDPIVYFNQCFTFHYLLKNFRVEWKLEATVPIEILSINKMSFCTWQWKMLLLR